MKKILFLSAALALCACGSVDVPEVDEPALPGVPTVTEKTKAFTFHVKGDFVKSYDEMDGGEFYAEVNGVPTDSWGMSNSRAASRLENGNTAGLTDLWVLDYVDGVKVQEVHQSSSDESFGTVAMALTYGHHDVKFVAAKGTEPSLTASALSWGRVKDTFVLDYPVDVVASSNGNRAPELKRAVCGVALTMTDKVPTNAKSIMVEFERSQSLALPSLAAAAVSVSGVTNDIPAAWVGVANNSFNVYSLCPTDEMTTDVHVVVTAKDGTTISDFTIEDVALKKNRITTLKGECFGRGSGFSVSIDDSWDEPFEVTF